MSEVMRYKHRGKEVTSYGFFWKTSLPKDRQEKIESWLKTLTEDEIGLLNDLLQDARQDAEWEQDYENSQ